MFSNIKKIRSGLSLAIALAGLGVMASAPAKAGVEPFLGDIQTFGFNFCPRGWAAANGQILPINQNQSLYSLLGTMYGGDGHTTFALPDLRGREAIGVGSGTPAQGARGGAESMTFTQATMAAHSHTANGNNLPADKHGPGNDYFSTPYNPDGSKLNMYHNGPPNKVMDPATIGTVGGGQAIIKRSPYQAVNFCIALQGLFPPRN